MKRPQHQFVAILLALIGFAAPPLAVAGPQSQQHPSVAEAARHARKLKKTSSKQARVWDNDTLPVGGSGVNTVGPTPVAPESAAEGHPGGRSAQGDSAAPSSVNPQGSDKQRIEAVGEMNSLKERLAEAERVLNVSQRAFDLQRDTYYSKTNFAEDKAGKARLDAMQADIATQQATVDSLKARIAILADKLRSLPPTSSSQEYLPVPPRSQPVPPVPPL
jgi:uncharacterized coiled-coil protein SlyX